MTAPVNDAAHAEIAVIAPGRALAFAAQAFDQFLDRGRLIARRLVFADQLELLAAFGFLRPRRAMRHKTRHLRARRRHASADRVRRWGAPDHRPSPPAEPAHAPPRRGISRALSDSPRSALLFRRRNHAVVVRHGPNIMRGGRFCSPPAAMLLTRDGSSDRPERSSILNGAETRAAR